MSDNGMKNVTISDIAQAAGVSKTTISRYLNGKYSMMSPETRNRIETVIRMANYHPNSIAQSLRGRRSMQIGVVVSDISSPFCAAMIRGIGHTLLDAGYVPLFVDSKEDPMLEKKLIQTLISRKVDGLIVNTSSYVNPGLIQLACEGIPVVLCDRYIRDYRFTYVGCTHRKPVIQLVAHLRREGFGKVAFFTQTYENNSTRFIRRDAFLQAMGTYYPELDPHQLVFSVDLTNRELTVRFIRHLMDSCPDGDIPAIITVNSATTMHLMGAIQEMGLRVPEDLGLCGPDDWGWDLQFSMSPLEFPGITSYLVHPAEIGSEAAKILLQMIQTPDIKYEDILLPCELMIRDSTRLNRYRKSNSAI